MTDAPRQPDGPHPPSLEERIAACPIHQGGRVTNFMDGVGMPDELRPLFQEIVAERGLYPVEVTAAQAKAFAEAAEEIMFTSGVDPISGRLLFNVFGILVSGWARDVREGRS